MSPYIYITNIGNAFDTAPSKTQTLVSSRGSKNDETVTRMITSFSIGKTHTQLMTDSQVGKALETRNQFESLRIVSAGFRLWKTSKSDTEAGTIKAYYSTKGAYVSKSLKQLVEDAPSG